MSKLRLQEPSFWVLTALADGRKHGYALIETASTMSAGRVSLKVATLYASLDRLSEEGLVVSDGDEVVDGRFRRYFRLTEEGVGRLDAEASRFEANAAAARKQLKRRSSLGPVVQVSL